MQALIFLTGLTPIVCPHQAMYPVCVIIILIYLPCCILCCRRAVGTLVTIVNPDTVWYAIESESCSVMPDSLRPHDYRVHGILQARILEWVVIPFSRESSQPRDQTQIFCIAGGFFTS